jgi:LacI family transcriptional regulator
VNARKPNIFLLFKKKRSLVPVCAYNLYIARRRAWMESSEPFLSNSASMNSNNIRIKDIAKLAGVSKGTVDRVLHKRGRVSEEAHRKVMKVLEEIDYKPNLIARTLSSHKNYRIIALLPNPQADEYWAQTREGVFKAASEWAYYNITVDVLLFDQYNKESFKDKAAEALASKPDGIITAPIFHDEALIFFERLNHEAIPYVLFNTNIPGARSLSFIGQDSFHSGKVGAELMYLGQHENGKLAVLHLDEDLHNSVHLLEKERGFRDYFNHKNSLHFEIHETSLRPNEPEFEQRLSELLSDPQLRGIFVSTSKGTSAVASCLEKRGKQNIRLIGYDILEENLRYLRAGIIDFLINQNPKRQAFLCIGHLANHLIFKKSAPERDLFPLEVITQQNVDSYINSGIH